MLTIGQKIELEMKNFEHGFYIGEWRVQPQKNLMTKNGEQRKLENRLTRVLLCLADAAPEVVLKDTLMNEVWPNKVVSDDTLSVAISRLRKALGCDARQPSYIATVPGYGFRLIKESVPYVQSIAIEPSEVKTEKFINKIWRWPQPFLISLSCVFLLVMGHAFIQTDEKKLDPLSLMENPHYARAKFLISEPSSVADLKEALTLLTAVEKTEKENAQVLLSMGKALIAYNRFNQYPDVQTIKSLYQRAIALDPKLAEAYFALSILNLNFERDQDAAERNMIICLSLRPDHIRAHAFYGRLLQAQGHFEAALRHYRIVQLLDPSFYSTTAITWVYNMARDYKTAERELLKLYAINPDSSKYHRSALLLYENMGDEERAYQHYRATFIKFNYSESELLQAEQAFKLGGLQQLSYWLANVKKEQENIGQGVPPLSTARYHVTAGEYNKALDYLEMAKEQNNKRLLWLKVDPKYEGLKDLPRYQRLLLDYGHTLIDLDSTASNSSGNKLRMAEKKTVSMLTQ